LIASPIFGKIFGSTTSAVPTDLRKRLESLEKKMPDIVKKLGKTLIKQIKELREHKYSLDEITPFVAIPFPEDDGRIFEVRLGAGYFDDGQEDAEKTADRTNPMLGAARRVEEKD
jgi:hypothetical protein